MWLQASVAAAALAARASRETSGGASSDLSTARRCQPAARPLGEARGREARDDSHSHKKYIHVLIINYKFHEMLTNRWI